MADEQPSGSPRPANPVSTQQAAATAVTPDAQTADILRRHQAGERLSSSEGGKLGQWKKKIKNAFGVGGEPTAATSPGQPALRIPVTDVAPLPPLGAGAGLSGPDSDIARRTALTVTKRVNAVTTKWIRREAIAAKVAGQTLVDFVGAASLDVDDQALISDLAPDVCAELNINPRAVALYTVGTILATHAGSLLLAVMELRAMREKEKAAELPVSREVPTPSPRAQALAIPPARPEPPGAPPTVT